MSVVIKVHTQLSLSPWGNRSDGNFCGETICFKDSHVKKIKMRLGQGMISFIKSFEVSFVRKLNQVGSSTLKLERQILKSWTKIQIQGFLKALRIWKLEFFMTKESLGQNRPPPQMSMGGFSKQNHVVSLPQDRVEYVIAYM